MSRRTAAAGLHVKAIKPARVSTHISLVMEESYLQEPIAQSSLSTIGLVVCIVTLLSAAMYIKYARRCGKKSESRRSSSSHDVDLPLTCPPPTPDNSDEEEETTAV